ncbi:NAD-dependent epimerase/dehydratase family protein [Actinopolymorpha sp. B17G11]|uniref:SDR family oxidoreductase n=1 Tax=unclassified Actinopolymorpha TaxID=2627063 RepID=UPI0032D93B3D
MRVAVGGSTGQVGRLLNQALRNAGHDVVGLSRAVGFDLADTGVVNVLAERLADVDAVVDVTNVITQDRAESASFFSAVAENIGKAATAAGVSRTVLLSIVGVDGIPNDAHYAAKYLQEQTHREYAPGVHIVRAAQFHEFSEMVLEWGRDRDRTTVPDFPVRPVHLDVVVSALLEAAAGTPVSTMLDVAGPRPERLADMVTRLVRARGERLEVLAVPASPELNAGACIPGADALIAGPSFDEWLEGKYGIRVDPPRR